MIYLWIYLIGLIIWSVVLVFNWDYLKEYDELTCDPTEWAIFSTLFWPISVLVINYVIILIWIDDQGKKYYDRKSKE